jgi:hypothetical protein
MVNVVTFDDDVGDGETSLKRVFSLSASNLARSSLSFFSKLSLSLFVCAVNFLHVIIISTYSRNFSCVLTAKINSSRVRFSVVVAFLEAAFASAGASRSSRFSFFFFFFF